MRSKRAALRRKNPRRSPDADLPRVHPLQRRFRLHRRAPSRPYANSTPTRQHRGNRATRLYPVASERHDRRAPPSPSSYCSAPIASPDDAWLETLLEPLLRGECDAVSGRQIARPDAYLVVKYDLDRAYGNRNFRRNATASSPPPPAPSGATCGNAKSSPRKAGAKISSGRSTARSTARASTSLSMPSSSTLTTTR